jgi:hypothetical protein
LPEQLMADIEVEARARRISKSEVVRERLQRAGRTWPFDSIADLIGSAEDLPTDLSARKKDYLRATSYGRNRQR